MAKKFITKKDYTRLIKGNCSALSTRLDNIWLGFSLSHSEKDTIIVIDLEKEGELLGRYSISNSSYEQFYNLLSNDIVSYIDNSSEISNEEEKEIEEVVSTDDNGQVVLTDVYSFRKLQNADINNISNEIRSSLASAGAMQLNVALLIRTVYEKKLFENLKYNNIYEYCSSEFGIARGTTSNWLMIATNFGSFNDELGRYVLDNRLANYSITQLVLLRSLSIDDIQAYFNESMTCKEIKEVLKGLNNAITGNCINDKTPLLNSHEVSSCDDEVSDDEVSDDENVEDCDLCISSTEQNLKLKFDIKGGTEFLNSSQSVILSKIIKKYSNCTFEVKVYLK